MASKPNSDGLQPHSASNLGMEELVEDPTFVLYLKRYLKSCDSSRVGLNKRVSLSASVRRALLASVGCSQNRAASFSTKTFITPNV